jgi:hypothetical protein
MGSNSTDALYQTFHEFIKQCKVVGSDIITPIDLAEGYDGTAGGLKLPDNPKFEEGTDQGTGSARDQ